MTDVLSALPIPGAASAALVLDRYLERRQQQGVAVLIEELSDGYHGPINWEECDIDPMIAAVFRINKAILDGESLENIRFLAQVIAGLKKRDTLKSDEFLKWAKIVEGMTRPELLLIGFSYQSATDGGLGAEERANEFKADVERKMGQAGVPPGEVGALFVALSRVGLFVPLGGFGPNVHMATERLRELGQLANLSAIRAAEA